MAYDFPNCTVCHNCGSMVANTEVARLAAALEAVTADRDEWRTQHENLLVMYRTAEDGRASTRTAATSACDELKRFIDDENNTRGGRCR